MKRIDWEFEKEVLTDCWGDPFFRVATLVVALGVIGLLVLTVLGFMGGRGWLIFLGSAAITFFVLQIGRRF